MYECYDEWWLPKDMEDMGYIFEYCDRYCLDMYQTEIDKVIFLTAFMHSGFRKEMEIGHPKFLSQAAKDSIRQWIQVDYNNDLSEFMIKNDAGTNNYIINQMYWIGWIYAYIHYMSKLPSKEIVNILPINYMIEQYYTGHEMNKSTYYNHIEHLLIK